MSTPSKSRTWPWAALLILFVCAAYWNAFNGAFLFDDIPNIVTNSSLRDLSNLSRVLFEYPNVTRPVVSLTLAIDYALFGNNPAGYHAFNVLAHALGSLLLFGVVRRSLLSERFKERYTFSAAPIAFCAAALWATHPLQTESVTYIIQRAESMMGMFYLLAIYALIRGAEPQESKGLNKWHVLAVSAALLGAGVKQVIATLPIVALCYDRCFISGTFTAALKRAPLMYAGMCLSWVVIGLLLSMSPAVSSAGFGMKKITMLGYTLSQPVVILHYLKLVVLPVNLCLDYVWNVERDYWRIVPCALVVLALLGTALWQFFKNTMAGFWAAWFFVILAPTSSFLPIGDLAFEHRIYLSLAGITVLFALLSFSLLEKLGTVRALKALFLMTIATGLAFTFLTVQRNKVYSSSLTMWQDVLEKRPRNPRALFVIGSDALEKGDLKTARELITRSIEAQKEYHESRGAMGALLLAEKKPEEAAESFREALKLNPKHMRSWDGLYQALNAQGKRDEAFLTLNKAVEALPNDPFIQAAYGRRLFEMRHYPEAIQAFKFALSQAPDMIEARNDLGSALATTGKIPEALAEFEEVLKRQPRHPSALYNRGNVLEIMGRFADAAESYTASLKINSDQPGALNALAWILATSKDDSLRSGKDAVTLAGRAVELTNKKHPVMLDTLAAAHAESGQFDKAKEMIGLALPLVRPGDPLDKELREHLKLYEDKKPLRR